MCLQLRDFVLTVQGSTDAMTIWSVSCNAVHSTENALYWEIPGVMPCIRALLVGRFFRCGPELLILTKWSWLYRIPRTIHVQGKWARFHETSTLTVPSDPTSFACCACAQPISVSPPSVNGGGSHHDMRKSHRSAGLNPAPVH